MKKPWQPRASCAWSRFGATASVAASVLLLAALASGSEVELSVDGKRVLVGKDVGPERWSITYNREVGGTVTGNVFPTDGGPPQFVWCEDVSPSEQSKDLTLSCWGADSCDTGCGEEDWVALGEVDLPRSFFQERRATPWESSGEPIVLPESFFEPRSTAAASPPLASTAGTSSPSGFQITPDGAQVLVNKDVGIERWAITRNLDDGTVTGNVFSGAGPGALFLWCEDSSPQEQIDDLTLACFTPEPSESPSPSGTPTPAPTPRPSTTGPTSTPTPDDTPSPGETPDDSPSPDDTPSPGETPDDSPSPDDTPSPGETPDASPSPDDTPSPGDTPEPGEIRCCDPDDGGFECEYRRPEQCAERGGTDIGPGSCSPNPCGG